MSGQITVDAAAKITGRLAVTGPDGRRGSVKIHAVLWDPARPAATIQGKLGGTHIAVVTQTR